MDRDIPLFMIFGLVNSDIPFSEVDITDSGKAQLRNTHPTGVQDTEKDRHHISTIRAGIRHRLAFVNCIKKTLKFFICVNMCIVSAPFPGDSFRRNICRNPDIVEISAENPHDTDTACLICDCLISSFSAP